MNFITAEACLKAISIDDVKIATSRDKCIMKAIEFVHTGRWFYVKIITEPDTGILELQYFRTIRD